MTLRGRIKGALGIDRVVAEIEAHRSPEVTLPKEAQRPSQIKERYLSALANIRSRIQNSENDGITDNFELAYFNIINYGENSRIFSRAEHDVLTSQLVDSILHYLNRRDT